jgi:hypothetical protein
LIRSEIINIFSLVEYFFIIKICISVAVILRSSSLLAVCPCL